MMKKNILLRGLTVVITAVCVSLLAIPAFADQVEGTTPLYSFYNSLEHDHFLTASSDEKDGLQNNYDPKHPYLYEGSVWRVETRPAWNNVPVYRFFNKKTYDHFYTISESEKAALEKTLAEGKDNYVYEGIAWYAHSDTGTPVYRLFHPDLYDHYYTMDSSVKDELVSSGGYRYEGIAWYEQQNAESASDPGLIYQYGVNTGQYYDDNVMDIEYYRGYQEGYNAGYNEGFRNGYSTGYKDGMNN